MHNIAYFNYLFIYRIMLVFHRIMHGKNYFFFKFKQAIVQEREREGEEYTYN